MRPVAHTSLSRRFPGPGWAWPRGDHDLLIKAVLSRDSDRAREAASSWLDRNDIDEASFREHRLLAALAHRHGHDIAAHPAYPRLTGLQRHLWARSQMAAREIKPVLAEMAERGVALMLLKGASRVALAHDDQKGRFAQDIDVVVPTADVSGAIAVLEAHGWRPADGTSLARLRAGLDGYRSMNFVGERMGDIDLHIQAYHAAHHDAADEDRLWRDAAPHGYDGVPVLVPAAADRAALAVGHGALDAHIHSDWLADCVAAISSEDMDWDVFARAVHARGLEMPAAIALSYVAQELSAAVPETLTDMLMASYRRRPLARLSTLLQAKPRMDMGPVLHGLRWLAKEKRKRATPDRAVSEAPALKGMRQRAVTGMTPLTGFALKHTLPSPAKGDSMMSLTLRLAAPAAARRIEFEINGREHHVARLRYRKLGRAAGTIDIRYRGRLRFDASDAPFAVEARPLRVLRGNHGAGEEARYGALAFQIVRFEMS